MLSLAALAAVVPGLSADLDAQGRKHGHSQSRSHGSSGARAKNVIFFVGDGMGVSTVTATRIYSVGIDGKLTVDKMPFTALSKTYTSDHITPDSAGTMTAMISGVNTNSGVIGYGPKTERGDFNADGDVNPVTTLLEMAKRRGKRVGVVSTARITHATPAACYAKSNERNAEDYIALQATPGAAQFNRSLGKGIDVLMGGGRRHFVPSTVTDEEGSSGRRSDGRDLRKEFQNAGYKYVWNSRGFRGIGHGDLPVLGLFESSHMEYEYDRPNDVGGEPSLTDMVRKSIDLLSHRNPRGYFLMVESGRIDHAHHAGNAHRALTETDEFDLAIEAAIQMSNLRDTLIVVTADHSHVFNIAGYPVRQQSELAYQVKSAPSGWASRNGGIMNTVYSISGGNVVEAGDSNGTPYTILGYLNGGGYRGATRVNPAADPFKGLGGATVSGPTDPDYLQEAAVPLGSETHSGEDVAIYAIGPGSYRLNGTVKNTFNFELMRRALGY